MKYNFKFQKKYFFHFSTAHYYGVPSFVVVVWLRFLFPVDPIQLIHHVGRFWSGFTCRCLCGCLIRWMHVFHRHHQTCSNLLTGIFYVYGSSSKLLSGYGELLQLRNSVRPKTHPHLYKSIESQKGKLIERHVTAVTKCHHKSKLSISTKLSTGVYF